MAKTTTTPMMPPKNPWLSINWKHTVAPCDATIITPTYCKAKGIDIKNLPEPYSGDINSNVVCLTLNPGWGGCESCFYGSPDFLRLTQNTLKHSATDYLWDTPISCMQGMLHDGFIWRQERTKQLRCAVCPKPLKLFYLEYFPYHTKKSFAFPRNLPSNEYRNWLLCQAMKDHKLIVLLRGGQYWFGIKDLCCTGQPLGKMLKGYYNLIIHNNPQNIYLTPKNFASKDWEKLVNALKS